MHDRGSNRRHHTYSSKGEFIAGMLLNKRKKKMNVHMKNLCETPNNK